jgi:hypothetical protein
LREEEFNRVAGDNELQEEAKSDNHCYTELQQKELNQSTDSQRGKIITSDRAKSDKAESNKLKSRRPEALGFKTRRGT